jgi:tetratricopeptide (TPR) repeat protein
MPQLSLDYSQTSKFFSLLKKEKKDLRLRAFYPSGHPFKSSDSGRKSSPKKATIEEWQAEGRGVYAVINDGGDTDSEITRCRAVFCEWDDRPKEWQIDAWKNLQLPEPTLQVDTGGKSIHNYWVFDTPIQVDEWKSLQTRLLDHADADRSLKNPSRVMRLPGTYHIDADGKPGGITTIIHASGNYYTHRDIEKVLPSRKMHDKMQEANRYTDYKPRSLDEIREALNKVPARKPGTGTYHIYRNLFWSLIKAVEEAGGTRDQAISLMESNSPSWKGLYQIANSGGEKVTAGTFWYWAKHFGWTPPAPPSKPELNITAVAEALSAEEFEPTGEKLQKIEADQLLQALRSAEKPFRYNIFTQQIEQEEKILEGIERYYLKLAQMRLKISKEVAIDCVVEVAKENPYDPVKAYLEHCSLSVEPTYIDRLASTYLIPADAAKTEPTLYDKMLKCTLIAAVARVFNPGCKHDNACVLLGEQGARKSSFWKALGGHFFSDALRDCQSKDDLMILHRSWIMEWAELDHITNKRQAGVIKAFLSQSTDMFRVPYGKTAEVFPRRGIIVGSTNSDEFLVDETGNRRFWVIPVGVTHANPIDVDKLMKEVESIWASAVHAYQNNEPHALSIEDEQQVNVENSKYIMGHPWKGPVDTWLSMPQNKLKDVTIELLLSEAICKPLERQTRGDQTAVGNVLKALKFVKGPRKTINGCRKQVYVRDSSA